jgi:RNA methyltransferase, TrmH family
MLSKNDIKLIRSLAIKKYRDAEGLFVAEGPKLVGELLGAFRARRVIADDESAGLLLPRGINVEYVGEKAMQRATLLTTPHRVLAVFEKPQPDASCDIATVSARELCIALDDIQNPGNLGTIIRTADWMGIRHVFCSPGTADVFSPKVLQATMGSAARVRVSYVVLPQALARCGAPVWGTFLDGENIYTAQLEQRGVIVIGNEGNGISPQVERTVTRRLFIPPWPQHAPTVESLNAGIAAAMTMAVFRGRTYNR